MNAPVKQLTTYQISFNFVFPGVMSDLESSQANSAFRAHSDAFHRLETEAKSLSCWSKPSQHPDDDFDVQPYELFDSLGELETVDEELVLSFTFGFCFGTSKEMPEEDVQAFRDLSKQIMTAVADRAQVSCRFLSTQIFREYSIREWTTLPA